MTRSIFMNSISRSYCRDYINNCEGINHQTALHIACEEDKVEIAELLCDNGAGLSHFAIVNIMHTVTVF